MFVVEDAFAVELFLPFCDEEVFVALSAGDDVAGCELVFAVRLIDFDGAVESYPVAVFRLVSEFPCVGFPHYGLDDVGFSSFYFGEREVEVSGGVGSVVCDLAFDPDVFECVDVEEPVDYGGDLGYGLDSVVFEVICGFALRGLHVCRCFFRRFCRPRCFGSCFFLCVFHRVAGSEPIHYRVSVLG